MIDLEVRFTALTGHDGNRWGTCYPHSRIGGDNRKADWWVTFERENVIFCSFFLCNSCKDALIKATANDRAKSKSV